MAKTVFISDNPVQMASMASQVGYDLSASCDAEAVMGNDWLHHFIFASSDTLKSTCGLTDVPFNGDQIKAGLSEAEIATYQSWFNDCYAKVQTWLNTLTNFHIWAMKGDCWDCEMMKTGILNLIDNVDQAYIVTKTGIQWLVEKVCRNVLAEDVTEISLEDMNFLQTYIIDNFNGSLADMVATAKTMETEIADFATAVSGKSNVTFVTLDSICSSAITSNSNYSNLETMYNT